jgi:hypothetical protein
MDKTKIYETKTFIIQTVLLAVFTFVVLPWLGSLHVVREFSGNCTPACLEENLCAAVVTYCSDMIVAITQYVLSLLLIVHVTFYFRFKWKNR